MKKLTACAAALGLALAGNAASGETTVPAVVRSTRDVALNLRVKNDPKALPGDPVSTNLVIRNKSRRNEPVVTVSVFANAAVGTPLWTGTVALKAHHKKTRHLSIDVPAGTTSLIAVAAVDDDDNPGNNIAGDDVSGHESDESGDDDGGTTTPPTTPPTVPPPAADPAAMAGAATYSANCASCHGADAKGTKSGPRLLGRSAGDVYEAMREGEDSMPRFLSLTMTDAKNIAAFLKNPAAATQPTTPVTPPPSGTAPTYTGQIATLLSANCTVCHTGTFASKGIQLDTYANASANASAALTAMSGGVMPPGSPLPASSIQLFSDWITGGKQQ